MARESDRQLGREPCTSCTGPPAATERRGPSTSATDPRERRTTPDSATAGESTGIALTARKNGRRVPNNPTPSTASATWTSASLAYGHDHHGAATAHTSIANTKPQTRSVKGGTPRAPARSAPSRYRAKNAADATPARTPAPLTPCNPA